MTTLSLRLILPDLPGPTDPADVVREIIAEGLTAAKDKAEAVSPVRTGRLRSGWIVRKTEKGAVLVNETPYANYVSPGKGRPPISRWPVKRDAAVEVGAALTRRKDEVAAAFLAGAFGGVK